MSEDGESFVGRWSRRKVAARQDEHATAPAEDRPAAVDPAAPADASASAPAGVETATGAIDAPLPSPEELHGIASEYREFLRPQVDPILRRAALKKLFQDPHFNVMDGLDVYIDDYSKPDPIPEEMLKTLAHAKGMLFAEKDGAEDAPAPESADAPAPPGTDVPRIESPAADDAQDDRASSPAAAPDRGA